MVINSLLQKGNYFDLFIYYFKYLSIITIIRLLFRSVDGSKQFYCWQNIRLTDEIVADELN